MLAGQPYRPEDPELVAIRSRAQRLMQAFNATTEDARATRDPIARKLFGDYGTGTSVRSPVYVDYGFNIRFGDGVFVNFGCVFLDVCAITIGDMTQIGPMSQLLAADHPRDPEARDAGIETGAPVTVGRNVWIGGGALVLPGVTVGDHAIIGAGAVVTRDVPEGRTAVGNPARLLPEA